MPTPEANDKQTVSVDLTDKEFSRLLDCQEYDGKKIGEYAVYIFMLGVSARENSIKATRQRKLAEEKAGRLDKFNAFIAQGMKLEDALQYSGLVLAQPKSADESAAA